MLPLFACNLHTALTSTDEKTNLDWDLHMTADWEKRTPFHLHIHRNPAAGNPQQPASSFPQFSALPAELQIRILEFCTPGTLFNAGQTCSTIRAEASKLFWGDEKIYYAVQSFWLLEGGYPGFAWWDSAFQCNVQNVEIEYIVGSDRFICPREDEKTYIQHHRVMAFWDTFSQCFPSAKRAVINMTSEIPSWWKDAEPVPLPLRVLIHACPPDVEVFALVLEQRGQLPNTLEPSALLPAAAKWQRSLYRWGKDSTWESVQLHYYPHKTVLMPPKHFSGPVGRYQQLKYRASQIYLRQIALWPLMLAAVGQHHFCHNNKDTPLPCPSGGCDATLTTAGEWIKHAASLHSQEWRNLEIVPDSVRAVFEERQRLVAMENEETRRRSREIKEAWNKDDGAERSGIERDWLAQLHRDERWFTGVMPRESRLWRRFVQEVRPGWEGFYETED